MQTHKNALQENSDQFLKGRENLLAKGCLRVIHSNGKSILALEGDLTRNNIIEISKRILKSTPCQKKCVELDMTAVVSIDMQAMALLVISLKKLKENGTSTKVTGLNGGKLRLAETLGMHFVTQVSQPESP